MRHILLGILMAAAAWTARAQTFETLRLQRSYAGRADDFTNGYARAVRCEEWGYDNFWNDKTEAMITRASNGQMVMEWESDPVKRIDADGARFLFLISADQSAQPREFSLWIDGRPCGALTNLPGQHWEQTTDAGVVCTFSAYDSNQWGDRMGFMELLVPKELVEVGRPVRFRLIGEKAESNIYFMIFKNRELLEELRSRAAVEELFVLSATDRGVEIAAGTQWIGRTALVTCDGRPVQVRFADGGDRAVGRCPEGAAVALQWQGHTLFEVADLRNPQSEYRIDGGVLVTVRPEEEGVRISRQRTDAGEAFDRLAGGPWRNAQVHILVSSHQDIAWMDSPYNCIEARDRLIVSPALDLLARHPDYRYDIEDALILEEYLERHPDRRSEIGGYIASGRLGIGASYTQPYEEVQSGEALVRQFYFGKRWVEREFPGARQRTYWNVDVPGRTLQMPQILKKCGVDHLMYSRHQLGIYDWFAPDGSSVRVYTPGHYTRAAQFLHKNINLGINKFVDFMEEFPDYRKNPAQPRVVGMLSAEDMSRARTYYDWIEGMKEEARRRGTEFPQLSHSTADRFMDSLSRVDNAYPQIRGERPDLWQYIHSATHADAFADYGAAATLLPQTELFASALALAEGNFDSYPKEEIDRAWKALIYPDHGWGGNRGNITDSLFAAKYRFARGQAETLLQRILGTLTCGVRTERRQGLPVVVYNGASWARSGSVRIPSDRLPGGSASGLRATDATGRPCAVQTAADGSLEIEAADVPAMGYTTLYLKEERRTAKRGEAADLPENESVYYRLEFRDGILSQIFDKQSGEALFDTSLHAIGDVVALRSVGNGAGEFSTMQKPTTDHLESAAAINPRWELAETGPVYTLYRSVAPFENAEIVRTLRLYRNRKRIDFDTEIRNFDGTHYLEYRQLFPLRDSGHVAYGVPFGRVRVGIDEMQGAPGERYMDEAREIHPRTTSGWIAGESGGVAVGLATSAALVDYVDPIHPDNPQTVLQPIMLASRRSCHPQGEFYSQRGTHCFRFTLSSEEREHRMTLERRLEEARMPLHAVVATRQWTDAGLAESGSFFTVGDGRAAVSTVKKAEEGDRIVLRLYNRSGEPVRVPFTAASGYDRIRHADLLERSSGEETPVIELAPYAIETYIIE